MILVEQTFTLNITPKKGPNGTRLIQVETMDPMTPQEFTDWIHGAATRKSEAPRPASRASVEVWRDTKEHPQPKAVLKKMDEFSQQYKKFKRKYPRKSHEELSKMTQEWLDMKAKFLESFVFDLGGALEEGGQSKAKTGLSIWAELSKTTKPTAIPTTQHQPSATIKEEKKNEII